MTILKHYDTEVTFYENLKGNTFLNSEEVRGQKIRYLAKFK